MSPEAQFLYLKGKEAWRLSTVEFSDMVFPHFVHYNVLFFSRLFVVGAPF